MSQRKAYHYPDFDSKPPAFWDEQPFTLDRMQLADALLPPNIQDVDDLETIQAMVDHCPYFWGAYRSGTRMLTYIADKASGIVVMAGLPDKANRLVMQCRQMGLLAILLLCTLFVGCSSLPTNPLPQQGEEDILEAVYLDTQDIIDLYEGIPCSFESMDGSGKCVVIIPPDPRGE